MISQQSIKIVEQEIERVNSTIKDEELHFGSRKVNSRVRELRNKFNNELREKLGDIPFYSEDVIKLFLDGKLKPSDKFGFESSEFYEFEKEFVKSGRNRDDLFHKLHYEKLSWYCKICYDEFADENIAIDHIKKTHDKETIQEEFEELKDDDYFDGTPTIKDLVDHEMAYFCKSCNKRFKDSVEAHRAHSHYKYLHTIDEMKKALNFEVIRN